MSNLFYHTVTDSQWKIIEPHLPKAKNTGRPSLTNRFQCDSLGIGIGRKMAVYSQRIWELEQCLP